MESDEKKYKILENVFQKINSKYVALPEEETKRNNKILQVVDRIIQKMRNKSVLFDSLYQAKFYGGSYYDGLKVGKPSEYDLDCVLCLPKLAEPTVEVSDKPGYVHLGLKNLRAVEKTTEIAPKYLGLDKLLIGDRLCTKKVKSWMESIMSTAINGNTKIELRLDETTTCTVTATVHKSGPAHTIQLQGKLNEENFTIDVDLVPCFTFFDDQWPKGTYKENPSKTKNTFFVVPKSPSDDHTLYWRLSFQEQERELISGYSVMKPTIRLIKKIRDRHHHKIASYFIKTVFLWELDKLDKNFWSKPLSYVFATMLRKYAEYLEARRIPYYWHEDLNLIGDLTDVTTNCIARKITNIADHIEKICNSKTDIYGVLQYFLTSNDDVETFKQETPLSKKLLKQQQSVQEAPLLMDSPVPLFQTISVDESSQKNGFEGVKLANVETLCVSLASEQKRAFMMMEALIDKVDKLAEDFDKTMREAAEQRSEMIKMIGDVNRKVDELEKKNDSVSGDQVELLLGATDRLKSTVEFTLPPSN